MDLLSVYGSNLDAEPLFDLSAHETTSIHPFDFPFTESEVLQRTACDAHYQPPASISELDLMPFKDPHEDTPADDDGECASVASDVTEQYYWDEEADDDAEDASDEPQQAQHQQPQEIVVSRAVSAGEIDLTKYLDDAFRYNTLFGAEDRVQAKDLRCYEYVDEDGEVRTYEVKMCDIKLKEEWMRSPSPNPVELPISGDYDDMDVEYCKPESPLAIPFGRLFSFAKTLPFESLIVKSLAQPDVQKSAPAAKSYHAKDTANDDDDDSSPTLHDDSAPSVHDLPSCRRNFPLCAPPEPTWNVDEVLQHRPSIVSELHSVPTCAAGAINSRELADALYALSDYLMFLRMPTRRTLFAMAGLADAQINLMAQMIRRAKMRFAKRNQRERTAAIKAEQSRAMVAMSGTQGCEDSLDAIAVPMVPVQRARKQPKSVKRNGGKKPVFRGAKGRTGGKGPAPVRRCGKGVQKRAQRAY